MIGLDCAAVSIETAHMTPTGLAVEHEPTPQLKR